MLTWFATQFGGKIIDGLLNKGLDAFRAYINKQITMEELRTQLLKILLETVAEIEKAQADAIARGFQSLMDAATKSKDVARAWAFVVYSQCSVLLWHQVGIPATVIVVRYWHPAWNYPSSGHTSEWAYLLLGACLGAGVWGLNSGPGAIPLDKFKSLIGK